MEPHHVGWILKRHLRADAGSDVAALCSVPVVPQPRHEGDHESGHLLRVVTRFTRLVRKPVPWHRGDDDMKRILRAATVRHRIRERPDHLAEFHERTWP